MVAEVSADGAGVCQLGDGGLGGGKRIRSVWKRGPSAGGCRCPWGEPEPDEGDTGVAEVGSARGGALHCRGAVTIRDASLMTRGGGIAWKIGGPSVGLAAAAVAALAAAPAESTPPRVAPHDAFKNGGRERERGS